MVIVSSFFVGFIGKSVLYYPTVFATLLSTISGTSMFTCLLGEMVYQLAAVATGEELLKFVAYTEFRQRYKSLLLAVVLPWGSGPDSMLYTHTKTYT